MDLSEKQNVVSFKFSKTTEKKKSLANANLDTSPINDQKNDKKEKKFIVSLDKDKSKPKPAKLVIPLPKKDLLNGGGDDADENIDALTREAMNELIKDANEKENESKSVLRIPLVSKRRIEGVELNEEDYEDVPIEEFGKAMMRGMGWDDNDVGEPIVEIRRGFSSHLPTDKPKSSKEEELELKKGSYCIFLSGQAKGKYGKVVDDDGLRMIVELASSSSSEKINTCASCLRAVPRKEHDKSKKCINSSKYDEYLAKQTREKDEREKEQDRHKNSRVKEEVIDVEKRNDSKKIKRESSADAKRKTDRHSREKEQRSSSRQKDSRSNRDGDIGKKEKSSGKKEKSKASMWLHPNLVVRIVDEAYGGGRYFREKVVVEDVVKPLVCNCRTSNNKLLEGLHQDQLETVIPREVPSMVMVVRGENKFQVAKLLYKDKEACKVMVNLVNDQTESLTLDFDGVCLLREPSF